MTKKKKCAICNDDFTPRPEYSVDHCLGCLRIGRELQDLIVKTNNNAGLGRKPRSFWAVRLIAILERPNLYAVDVDKDDNIQIFNKSQSNDKYVHRGGIKPEKVVPPQKPANPRND